MLQRYAAGERDFSGVDLSRANLADCILVGTNLSGANLTRANLKSSKTLDIRLFQYQTFNEIRGIRENRR
ncbi:pentapeptide repeat-containing protein [Nostoc sp.]|uniref:pentapeptide repeat-containing protein n=1 Tax=Nostoc sp. TaxID=1180 RepID=UPI002FFAA6B4